MGIISVQQGLLIFICCAWEMSENNTIHTDVQVFNQLEIEIVPKPDQVVEWVEIHQITVVQFQSVPYFGYLQLAPIRSLKVPDKKFLISLCLKFAWSVFFAINVRLAWENVFEEMTHHWTDQLKKIFSQVYCSN